MAGDDVEARGLRADGARNREHLLEVAEEFFVEQGVGGPMRDIARRAGLGPGTLYRHFPTRESLIASLLQARYDELDARRRAIEAEETDSAAALERWLEALREYVTVFDGLPDPLRAAITEDRTPLTITCEALVTTTGRFLAAAQREGLAQRWVGSRDLVLAVLATAWVGGAALADDSSRRGVRAMLRAGWAVQVDPRTGTAAG